MSDSNTRPKFEQTYDLHLTAGKRQFRLKNNDRGVTLTDWELRWTADGKDDRAPLENIAQVRLQSGGDWKNPLNQCQVTFRDGHLLTVHDGSAYGVADDAQTPVYADFVRALHARLALAPPGVITFIQGLPETNFHIVMGASVLMGLMFVALPFVLWIWTGEIKALLILIAGGVAAWPIYKLVTNNAPRPYDPKQPPQALLE